MRKRIINFLLDKKNSTEIRNACLIRYGIALPYKPNTVWGKLDKIQFDYLLPLMKRVVEAFIYGTPVWSYLLTFRVDMMLFFTAVIWGSYAIGYLALVRGKT